jgi:transcriptional regulator with XRE-family HTH domain
MNIGSKIRKLRLRDNLTQEELSEGLGVTTQAISRWETLVTYPDITLLPVIANYFEVTIDHLMGMEEFNDIKKLNETYTNAHNLEFEGKYDEAITIFREALKLHPNNYGLMSDLTLALTIKNSSISDLNEAITISEKVLEKSTSEKIRSTTRANLCQLYLKVNEFEKGFNLIKSLPHIWECRELLIPELYNGEQYSIELKKSIAIIISVLTKKIGNVKKTHISPIDDIFALGVINLPEDKIRENAENIIEFLMS